MRLRRQCPAGAGTAGCTLPTPLGGGGPEACTPAVRKASPPDPCSGGRRIRESGRGHRLTQRQRHRPLRPRRGTDEALPAVHRSAGGFCRRHWPTQPSAAQVQTPKEKRKLTKRTVFACTMILLLIPVTLFTGFVYLENRKYYFIMLLVLLECLAPLFMNFEGRNPQAREVVVIAVLLEIGVAGRTLFFMLPNQARGGDHHCGRSSAGEWLPRGRMTMLVSNIMFGRAVDAVADVRHGLIGFLAGVLFARACCVAAGSLAVPVHSAPRDLAAS